jgi:hypothetical protein
MIFLRASKVGCSSPTNTALPGFNCPELASIDMNRVIRDMAAVVDTWVLKRGNALGKRKLAMCIWSRNNDLDQIFV